MIRLLYIPLISLLIISCKKEEDRNCWKGHGEETSIEIPLDSVHTFHLEQRIKYRIFEDNQRKVVIKGGENMVGLIDLSYDADTLTISDLSKCHFLRDSDRMVEVEIHYPTYHTFYFTASDSVIFENTIQSDTLIIEMKEAGGSMVLDVDNYRTEIVVSRGTANYILTGRSDIAGIKVQDKGFADASNFTAEYIFGFQNSTSDLYLNLDSSSSLITIHGTGDVFYKGTPFALTADGVGSGKLIQY